MEECVSGYPNATPPPQSTNHDPDALVSCCQCVFVVIVNAIFYIIVIIIVWSSAPSMVLSPRIPELRVDYVSLSNFSVNSSSLIYGNWDVELAFTNPNHKSNVYYDKIEARVYYKWNALSLTNVPPFDQITKNQTVVRVKFPASAAYVDECVLNGINQERRSGSVNFNLMLFARVTFKPLWPERRFLNIYCGDLIVAIAPNGGGGKLTGGSRDCKSM